MRTEIAAQLEQQNFAAATELFIAEQAAAGLSYTNELAQLFRFAYLCGRLDGMHQVHEIYRPPEKITVA